MFQSPFRGNCQEINVPTLGRSKSKWEQSLHQLPAIRSLEAAHVAVQIVCERQHDWQMAAEKRAEEVHCI